MKLPNVAFWIKKKRDERLVSAEMDKKLLKSFQTKVIPRWPQLKYLGRFLSPKEKRVVAVVSSIVALTIFVWGVSFLWRHLEKVPAYGGEYSEALIGQPRFLNPIFGSADDVDSDLTALIYSGLFHYNEKGELTPDLATSYSVDSRSITYNIELKENVVWSDGEPFTADDVVFTFEAIQNPEVGSPLRLAFQEIKVEKITQRSVRFTLKEPFPALLTFLTVGILPEHIWSDISPSIVKLAKFNLQPVGTGPWSFSKLVKDANGNIQSYELARNDKYYEKLPYLKTLTFKFFTDQEQALNALRGQNVMSLSFIPLSIKEKISGKNYHLYSFRIPQYTALFLNLNQPSLKDADTRRALAHAIDRNKIINEVMKGEAEMVNSPFTKSSLGFDPNLSYYAFSADKANQLLDKKWKRLQPEEYFNAEYTAELKRRAEEIEQIKTASSTAENVSSTLEALENQIKDNIRSKMPSDQAFYRRDAGGGVLRLAIVTVDTPEYRQAAEETARLWRAVGVQTALESMSGRQIIKEVIRNRGYDVLLYGQIAGSDPDPYPFWHSSQTEYPGMNITSFVDRKADKLLEDGRSATSTDSRAALYKQFQKILMQEIPAIFLYNPLHSWAMAKEVKGVYIDAIYSPSDRYAGMSNWYVKTSWKWKN